MRIKWIVCIVTALSTTGCNKRQVESLPPLPSGAATLASTVVGRALQDCPDCPELVVLPKGIFILGNPDPAISGYTDRGPPKQVCIDYEIAMGKFEVTQAQWRAVMGDNPAGIPRCGDTCPIESVSFDDVQAYIVKLNDKTGLKFRLPSEAEWEYAARAGTDNKYGFGNDEKALLDYAWIYENGGDRTHKVGLKKSNPWGLYDIHGNVSEWTQDCYINKHTNNPGDGSPVVHTECSQRVTRGGTWADGPLMAKATVRDPVSPSFKTLSLGFRLVRVIN
jgi:formylglycine-generating enzyme required for sulfatase activity